MSKPLIILIWIIIGSFILIFGFIRVITYGLDIYPVEYPRAWYDSDAEYFKAMKDEFPKWQVPKDYKPTNKTSDELMFGDDPTTNTDDSIQEGTEQPQDQTIQDTAGSQITNQINTNQSNVQDTSNQQTEDLVEDGNPRIFVPNSYSLSELIPVLKRVLDSYYEEYASYIQAGDHHSPMVMAKGLDSELNKLCIQFEGAFNQNGGEKNPFYNDVNASLSSLRQTVDRINESFAQNNLQGVLDQMGSMTDARNRANAAYEMIHVPSK